MNASGSGGAGAAGRAFPAVPDGWSPGSATAALIVVAEEGYLLQNRDERPGIWYPGHWGLFGGLLEPGESEEAALRRELAEELELEPERLRWFLEMSFRFAFDSRLLRRAVFEVVISRAQLSAVRLHEGRAMRVFHPHQIDANLPLVPCDRFVLDLHISKAEYGARA